MIFVFLGVLFKALNRSQDKKIYKLLAAKDNRVTTKKSKSHLTGVV